MAEKKKKDVLTIEKVLEDYTTKHRLYGCKDVTIGFPKQGRGTEVASFVLMDSTGVVKCYEIRATAQSIKSKEKEDRMSFYGHYNYLVVPAKLYDKMTENNVDFYKYIPADVGLITVDTESLEIGHPSNAKKRKLSVEDDLMIKESLIRSMYYQLEVERQSSDMDFIRKVEEEKEQARIKNEEFQKKYNAMYNSVLTLQGYASSRIGHDVSIIDLIKMEQRQSLRRMIDSNKPASYIERVKRKHVAEIQICRE